MAPVLSSTGVLHFGNSLLVLHLRGDLLEELIEGKIAGNRSGLAIGGGKGIYDRERTDGKKTKVFSIDSESIQAAKVYRVTTTDYLAEGDSGLEQLIELPESQVDKTSILLRDACKAIYSKEESD